MLAPTETEESTALASPDPLFDSDPLSDSDLLDAWIRDRHAASLAAIVDRYAVMVLSVCRRRCRSQTDAEDAFQTTFLYLARNAGKIRNPERLAGWLQRVAQRSAVATLKPIQGQSEPMVDPPADPDDPLDRLSRRHNAIVLDEELAELPEHYRSALVMHIYQDRSIQWMAEHLGISIGSIRGRLQRGKKLLAQRLRCRGVVPVLAMAAVKASLVSNAHASQACVRVIQGLEAGDLTDPRIDPSLLDSLLAPGARLMPALYTASSLFLGALVLVVVLMTGESTGQGNSSTQVTLSSSLQGADDHSNASQISVDGPDQQDDASETARVQVDLSRAVNGQASDMGATQPASETSTPAASQLFWTERLAVPEPTSTIAQQVNEALSKPIDLQIRTTILQLPEDLAEAIGVPVLLDRRGIEFADLEANDIAFTEQAVPLRTALRKMLRPLGLKAIVEDEGLVITADPSQLVHRGIGTSRWINIDEDAEQQIADVLDQTASCNAVEMPLSEFVSELTTKHQLPILLDRRALEEIGLSEDEPVTISVSGVRLRSLLSLVLHDLDLTYAIQGESLVLTTIEAAEYQLASRIYWLEGMGVAQGEFQAIINLIQTTIQPDTWEALGGPSTMTPVVSARPAISISTTYPNHQVIEQLFRNLRESHFGQDPVMTPVQVPVKPTPSNVGGVVGGMGGMGGGGMGGGGMGGGGGMF